MVFGQSKVYMTKEITSESLVRIYKALGVEAKGRVAVKISTGEGGNKHYLKPTLIRKLVDEINGTIVECCTAYHNGRSYSLFPAILIRMAAGVLATVMSAVSTSRGVPSMLNVSVAPSLRTSMVTGAPMTSGRLTSP